MAGIFGQRGGRRSAAFDPKSSSAADKMFILGALLSDLGTGDGPKMTMGVQQYLGDRQRLAKQQEWEAGLLSQLSGEKDGAMLPTLQRPNPAAPISEIGGGPHAVHAGAVPGAPVDEGDGASALAAAMSASPAAAKAGPLAGPAAAPSPGPTYDLQKIAPHLLVGALRGYPGAADAASIIDKVSPDIQFVNGVAVDRRRATPGQRVGVNLTNVGGWQVDSQDPGNAGKFFGEPPVKGATPLFDQNRQHVGWKLMDGTVQAIQQSTAAETAGRTSNTLFRVPNPDGSESFMTGEQFLGGAQGPGGPGGGVGTSQSPADKVYGEGTAKASAERFNTLQTRGQQAPGKISTLQRLQGLIGDYDGGRLTPVGMELASVFPQLGMKIDPNLPNKQAAAAIANQLVLDMTGGSLGVAISNADRDFLSKTAPNLMQTAQGRKLLVDSAIKTAQREQTVAGMARQWQQRYGRLDKADGAGKTFDDYLTLWANKNPLFAQ